MVWLIFGGVLGLMGTILLTHPGSVFTASIKIEWLLFLGVGGLLSLATYLWRKVKERKILRSLVYGTNSISRFCYTHPVWNVLLCCCGAMVLSFSLSGLWSHDQQHRDREIGDWITHLEHLGPIQGISSGDSQAPSGQNRDGLLISFENDLKLTYWLSSSTLTLGLLKHLNLQGSDISPLIRSTSFTQIHAKLLEQFQSISSTSFFDPGAFLSALLLGNRRDLDQRVMIYFRQAGLLHILALSGFHLGLILGVGNRFALWYKKLIPYMAKRGFLPPFWFTQFLEQLGRLIILLFCLLYCLIAIPGPGLYRAALMAGTVQVARIFNIPLGFWHGYWLSMGILLLVDPNYLSHWGFLLSYLALFGLVWASKPLESLLKPVIRHHFSLYLSTGLAAVWATLPFFLFTTFKDQGLAINGILMGPLMGWVVTLWALLGAVWLVLPLPWVDYLLGLLGDGTYFLLIQGRLISPLRGSPGVLWLIWALVALLIGVYQYWYSGRHDHRLRLPSVFAQFPGTPGFLNEKALWPKLHDQPTCSRKDRFLSLLGRKKV